MTALVSEPTEDQVRKSRSKRERSPKSAYDRGLDLLARRMHFAAELRTKLARRGYPEVEVEGAMERLTAGGFLNEQEAANMLVRSLQRRGYGRRRLELDLRRRGADAAAAGAALEHVGDEEELERAGSVAARWRSSHPSRDAAALARHLERRGFAPRTIGAVLFDSADDAAGEVRVRSHNSC
ncbi:MAG: regulatory protein RecX [Acidobacteria bacterium]|nr:regulatory protein RecX [Acidobacteriota bacterium]